MIFLALANLIVVVLVLLALPSLRTTAAPQRVIPWVLWTPVAFAVVAGAIAIYAMLGSPQLGDRPLGERTETASSDPGLVGLVERARDRLAEYPADTEAWMLLANAHGLARRYDDAALAMAEASVLDPGNAELLARYGEYIVLAHDGMVTPVARRAFAEALSIDPGEPVARFYGGIALAQSGDTSSALLVWQELLEESSADAPWIGELRRHIADAEALVSGGEGIAGMELADDERLDLVTGMVEGLALRLEDEPENLEGWRRLADSYTVLGDWSNARKAWEHALGLAPGDGELWDGFAAAVAGPISPDSGVAADALADMERVLEVRPENRHALYVSGLAAAETGDLARAHEFWTRLRDLFPPSSAEYDRVRVLVESLGR